MALKRATKSIPLTGGTTEEAQDFVLEPAGMAFVKNGRYPATDRCVKARSFEDGKVTGYSNYTQDVYGSWGFGNKLALIGNNEVCYSRDGGNSWKTEFQKTDLLGIQRVLSTAEQSGGNSFSWAPVASYTSGSPNTYPVQGYAVAFERVVHDSGNITNTRDVVIQAYDSDGMLLEEMVLTNCNAPNVKPADGFALVWYTTTGGILKCRAVTHSSGDLIIGSSETLSSSEGIQQFCQLFDTTAEQWFLGLVGQNFGDMRLGYSFDLHYNNGALVAFNRKESLYGVVAWKEDNGTGRIRAHRTLSGAYTDNYYTVVTDTAAWAHQVLDVCENDSYVYVLYTRNNKTTGLSELRCWQATLASFGAGPISTYDLAIETLQGGMYINGSVRPDSTTDKVWIATTRAQGNPKTEMYTTAGGHRIDWYRFPSGLWSGATTSDRNSSLYSHRLTSGIAIDKDGDAHFCAQQWDNWNPDDSGQGGGGDPNLAGVTPTHKKPVTTLLIRPYYDANNYNVPMASFDAGQSKACLPGLDEQNIQKNGDLYYFGNGGVGTDDYNQFWYGNRVLLTATDDYFFLDTTAAPAFVSTVDPKSDARASLLAGSARFAIYHLNSNIKVHSAKFPDGMLLGTSAPSWYDGSTYVMEAHPFDSPEIVGAVEKSGDGVTHIAYQDLGLTADTGKVVQAVIGFYDANGRVHRSAPSAEVWIGRLEAADTVGTTALTLYVTPPLTMNRLGDKYFLEIYESWSGEAPQLAATRPLPANGYDGNTKLSISYATNMNPTAGASTEQDIVDYRASKILYTDGNVLAADPWPNFDFIVKSGRRLFAHSISDPNTIYYSKTFEQNVAPEFSASLTVSLGNEIITAMGTIDDKVILFTEEGCWVMHGVGPDNTGANGDFFVDKLPFAVGCTDQDSVLTYEDGIAFYSSSTQEFHTITRDLLVVDIGEAIKEMSAGIDDIRAAAVFPLEHEVRFYCDYTQPTTEVADSHPTGTPFQPPRAYLTKNQPGTNNTVLFAYSFKYQKWSIRTFDVAVGNGIAGNGVINYGRNRFGIISDSYVFREEIDGEYRYSDKMYWETPDIKVNQLQDFGRFYQATILGKYLSSWSDTGSGVEAGDLQVVVRYDYEGPDATVDTHLFRANVDFDPADGQALQLEVPIVHQKCQSVRFEITEVATTGVEVFEPTYTTGQGFELVAIDLHYGAKGGSKRLPAGRRR